MSTRIPSGLPPAQGLGEDPLTFWVRVFCKFFQIAFQSLPTSDYHWDPDDKNSEIIVQEEGTIDKEVVEKRPAVIVSSGQTAWANVALDAFAGPLLKAGNPNPLHPTPQQFTPNFDFQTGARRHTDLLPSMMIAQCLSREGTEARRIAWFCAYAVKTLKRALMRAGLHRVGEEIQISAQSPAGSIVQPDSKEIISVSVTIPFWFQDTWTFTPEDKLLLREVDVALSSQIRYPAPGAVPIKAPGINGQVIGYSKLLILSQTATAGPFKTPRPRR